MNRAYELYLEQIEVHETSHPSSLAVDVLQAYHPDLSCTICYPVANLYRPFRRFWGTYRDNYFATQYSQKTNDSYCILVAATDYNTARAAARDIVFSCRYNNDLLDPKEVIAGLLLAHTPYTLAPTLPLNFEATLLDLHIEDLLPSTPASTRPRTENLLFDFQNQLGRTELNFDVSPPRSIFTLGPEQLADTGVGSSTNTYIPIPPSLALPSSPISEIPYHYTRETTPPPRNRLFRYLQQTFSPARTTVPPSPLVTEYYPTVNLDINVTPRHTPPLLNTPPLNDQNLIDPLDHYIQNQDATIVRADSPPQFEEINLQPLVEELNPILPPNQPENLMGDQALRDAAQAITGLANALGQGSEKTLITVADFYGDGTQDPADWLKEFRRAATANRWSAERKLQLAPVYLKGVALDWYTALNPVPNVFNDNNNQNRSFQHLFKTRFYTTKQKALWQKQLFEIKQGPTETVDGYVNRFRTLQTKVDPTGVFPADFVKQLFIQGLRSEYAVNVQAAIPNTLTDAIEVALRWETGKLMTTPTTNTDQAIQQLTDQIAKLSINLAQTQTTPTSSVNYADNRAQTPRMKEPPICYYCGRTGHFIRDCNSRKQDQRQGSNSRRNNNNNNRNRNNNQNRDRNGRSSDRYSNNRDRSRSRNNSRPRSQSRDNNYRSRNNDNYHSYQNSSNRSPSPYHRSVNYLTQNQTQTPSLTASKWKTLLNNPSIRGALATHLYEEAKNANLVQTPAYTTPVKCNVSLQNKPYQAIIDSGASISMIAHKAVKELGLTIEKASNSLIVPAVGTSTRPLGIIKDLPIEIDHITIPLTVEVVDTTSYSLLLGNDWNQKVEANYNWKNGCYTFKWENKKHTIPTTYESNQPLPSQPTVTAPDELDLYEPEYLYPREAYTFDREDSDQSLSPEENEWTTYHSRRRNRKAPKQRVCGNCGSPDHLFANCPTNQCNRCQEFGHIAVKCPKQAPRRTTCPTCHDSNHLYRDCPNNVCRGCSTLGHIEAYCPLATWKRQNLVYQCGCTLDQVDSNRLPNHSTRRTHHCCQCKVPNRPEVLRLLEEKLVCPGCYSDFHCALDREDPRSIHFFTQGEGRGMLVNCKVCNKADTRPRMCQLDSLREELWFCELEHLYAYKASQDIQYNPNYNLWTRIKRYTESTKNAGHQYEMNQTRIYRLAKILLDENDQTIAQALEPLTSDRITQPWSYEEMQLILQAESDLLSENDIDPLQAILDESFDTSHPDYDQKYALAVLRRNFTVPVDLCQECLHVKHQEELNANQGYCDDCKLPDPEIYSPPAEETVKEIDDGSQFYQLRQQVQQQDQLIKQLQARIETLETTNAALLCFFREEAQNAHHRANALDTLCQNF